MTEVSIVGPTDGETIRLGPTRMRILEDGSTTGHRLGMAEAVLAPRTEGPAQHRHEQHDEGFYVVSGIVRFTVGETSHDAVPGTLVMVPPGAPHTFANPFDEPATLVTTFTPDFYVQYFRDMQELFASGDGPSPADVASLMARYGTVPSREYATPQD